jgi:hypothetical protein
MRKSETVKSQAKKPNFAETSMEKGSKCASDDSNYHQEDLELLDLEENHNDYLISSY